MTNIRRGPAIVTDKFTKDGLRIWDLDPLSFFTLYAVPAELGHSDMTLDSLPAGSRVVTRAEWQELIKPNCGCKDGCE